MNSTQQGFEHAALQCPTIRDITITTIEQFGPPLYIGPGFYYLLGMSRIFEAVWSSRYLSSLGLLVFI